MRNALVSAALLAVLSATTDSIAHSWYPAVCCDKHDCGVANYAFVSNTGKLVVVDNGRQLIVPDKLTRRTSPDQQIHICYNRIDVEVFGLPPTIYCVFFPPQA